jgi:hypothetical protein
MATAATGHALTWIHLYSTFARRPLCKTGDSQEYFNSNWRVLGNWNCLYDDYTVY